MVEGQERQRGCVEEGRWVPESKEGGREDVMP